MQALIQFSKIEPNQKIASIGCGGGLWEVMLGFEIDNLEIHLQDIDANLLNETELKNTIEYFEKQYKKPVESTFAITIGDNKNSNLTSNYFDKVLLINSLHEFEYQAIILNECFRILKPNGQLIIEEQLAQYAGELHDGCGKRLFLEAELIEAIKKTGFHMIESQIYENKIFLKFTPSL
jgi:ubiquinone/menaquinone biosynthesis C-methylase UbiE